MGLSLQRGAPGWALFGAIAASVAVAPKAIADGQVGLSWSAVEACPSRAWVVARVERYLDGTIALDAASALHVGVHVAPDTDRRFHAHVEVSSTEGRRQREFDDADCVVVADAVAFIVAQAIDPAVDARAVPLTAEEVARGREGGGGDVGDAGSGSASSEPTGEHGSARGDDADAAAGVGDAAGDGAGADDDESGADDDESGADDDESDTDDDESDTDDDESDDDDTRGDEEDDTPPAPPGPPLQLGWSTGLSLTLGWQPLPAAGPGAVAQLVAHVGRSLRVELGAGYYTPQSVALAMDSAAEARFERIFGSLALCLVAPSPQTDFGLCLASQAGVVRGRGVAFTDGRDLALPEVSVSLGPLLVHRLSRPWALRVELAPTYGALRPRFLVSAGSAAEVVVHAAEPIGFFGRIGIELRID